MTDSNQANVIMDAAGIDRALTRIAHEVLEANEGAGDLAVVGIVTRGDVLAEKLAAKIGQIEGVEVPLGTLDISFYRDDVATLLSPEEASAAVRRAVAAVAAVQAGRKPAPRETGSTSGHLFQPIA